MGSKVKVECGTVGFATFEGYDHPTSSGRVVYFLPACCASRTLVKGSHFTSACLAVSFRIQRHLDMGN